MYKYLGHNLSDPSSEVCRDVIFLHPLFLREINKLIDKCDDVGLNINMFESRRSFSRQEKLYRQGREDSGPIVTNAAPGFSLHQYGLAADFAFYYNDEWSWDGDWKLFGEQVRSIPTLEWGTNWKSIKDCPHVQLNMIMDINTIKKIYEELGLEAVWDLVYDNI